MLIRRQSRLSCGVEGILVIGITVTTLVTSVATASAQNIFEALFGRLWNSPATSYADPNAPSLSPEATRSEGGVAYCVRLCDGRQFPMQRSSGASSAQVCSSFCTPFIHCSTRLMLGVVAATGNSGGSLLGGSSIRSAF